jgi:hypothetical protein
VRAQLYETVGGLNAVDLPVAFNDVDLCLKIRAKLAERVSPLPREGRNLGGPCLLRKPLEARGRPGLRVHAVVRCSCVQQAWPRDVPIIARTTIGSMHLPETALFLTAPDNQLKIGFVMGQSKILSYRNITLTRVISKWMWEIGLADATSTPEWSLSLRLLGRER